MKNNIHIGIIVIVGILCFIDIYAACNSPNTGLPVTLGYVLEKPNGDEMDNRFLKDEVAYVCLTVDGAVGKDGTYYHKLAVDTSTLGADLSSHLTLAYWDGVGDCELDLDSAGFTYTVLKVKVTAVIVP